MQDIYSKILTNKKFQKIFILGFFAMLIAVFFFYQNTENQKIIESIKPAIAVENIAGTSYKFIKERNNSQEFYSWTIDNPDNIPDYKWQFLSTGIKVLIDRKDDKSWQELVREVELIPEYSLDSNTNWEQYNLELLNSINNTTTLSGFLKTENSDGTIDISREQKTLINDIEEIFTETWTFDTKDENPVPKGTFQMTSNNKNLWRLKWILHGIEGIEKDNLNIADDDNYPITRKIYSEGELIIDVNDFEAINENPNNFSLSEYTEDTLSFSARLGIQKEEENTNAGRIEAVFYPQGTDGERFIDPAIVAPSANPGWSSSKQRNVFYDGEYYFLIYTLNAGTIYYRSATSTGNTWSSATTLISDQSTTAGNEDFDTYQVNNTKFDLAYISNSSEAIYVRTCTTTVGTIACTDAAGTTFNGISSVAVTRTPSANRIWVGGRDSADSDDFRIYSASSVGDANSTMTWTGEYTGGEKNMDGPVTMIPYENSDKILFLYHLGGNDDDMVYTTAESGQGDSGLAPLTTSAVATAEMGNAIRISDTDFRFVFRDDTAGTIQEWKYNGVDTWTQIDSNIDPDSETDQRYPALSYDANTDSMYLFSVDTGDENVEMYKKATSGSAWLTETVVDGAEAGIHTYPTTQMHENPIGAHNIAYAYRVATSSTYDLYVGSIGISSSISSAADQVFSIGQATTSISAITIINMASTTSITATNDIRITIATTSVDMRWDTTDTLVTITGTASSKVNTTASYEDDGATLVIDVTSDFSADERITVSDLSFVDFNTFVLSQVGVLQMYLEGASDTIVNDSDTKFIAISGALTASNHSFGQITNQWTYGSSTVSNFYYRYQLTGEGEPSSIGTTTIDLSNISGVVTGDITNAELYYDFNGDGLIAASSSWNISYTGTQDRINSLAVDTINGVIYAGQGDDLGDGDIYACQPQISGDADGICEDGEWSLSYNGARYKIQILTVDTINGSIYAGQGYSTGDSDIYVCQPLISGNEDGICEDGEWSLSYDGGEESVLSLTVDTINGTIYAGQGDDSGDGDIYACQPQISGDADGLCEIDEWSISYDGTEENIWVLTEDAINGVIYAGQGYGTGDGDIYACQPQISGDADGLCETNEWSLSYDGSQEYINSLIVDIINGAIYAGQGTDEGDGDIYVCRPQTFGDADGLCETNEWILSYDGAQDDIEYLTMDINNGIIYAGQGDDLGDGDIYSCQPQISGDEDGLCEIDEWSLSYDGTQEHIGSLTVDTINGVIYAGQGWDQGDGNIFYHFIGDTQIGNNSMTNISGSNGAITFTNKCSQVIGSRDYLLKMTVDNIANTDQITINSISASSTGYITSGVINLGGTPSSVTHFIDAIVSSNANQTFIFNQATTTISDITITEYAGFSVTAANDIRITIATTSVDMRWDITDTLATISGSASAKVNTTVSYEDNEATLLISVSSDFAASEDIIISDLSFINFNAINTANQGSLELYLDGSSDTIANNSDDKTIAIIGSLTSSDHTLDQITNQWIYGSSTISNFHYRYQLTGVGEGINISTTTLSLSNISGVSTGDISNANLYYDIDGDGTVSAGDTQIGDNGTVDISGTDGTITFASSTYVQSIGNREYIMEMTVDNIANIDQITIDSINASSTGNVTNEVINLSGILSSVTHYIDATISSNANQIFIFNSATTSIEAITITEHDFLKIDPSNDIRIRIATTSVNMRWDTTDTLATITGTALAKVNATVSYEDNGATLLIDVSSDFASGEDIVISDLSFVDFNTVNAASQGSLELYLDGSSDTMANNSDDKTVIIKGTLMSLNHSLGQVTNQWTYGSSTVSNFHYRYQLSGAGEAINIATTTINLSNISGVSTGDISDAKLYYDTNGDGLLTATSAHWTVSHDGPQQSVYSLTVDFANETVYAGQGNNISLSHGDIYSCQPQISGDADGFCEEGEWSLSYAGSRYGIESLTVDTINGTIYAGQAGSLSLNNIYSCQPLISGNGDGLCEEGEWSLSYDGVAYTIESLIMDTVNGTVYAGQGWSGGHGDIYSCQPQVSGNGDGLCEDGEWSLSYDGSGYAVESLTMDTTNGTIYAGYRHFIGDGDIYSCQPLISGNGDGLCEEGEWSMSYDGARTSIGALIVETSNGTIYAGEGIYASNGDIYSCQPLVSGDADGLCEDDGEWILSHDGARRSIESLTVDTNNGTIYAGQGSDLGDADIYACQPLASGDADGLCEEGEWSMSYDGDKKVIHSLIAINGIIYAGQGNDADYGDILYGFAEDIQIGDNGIVNISGTNGTITFATSSTYIKYTGDTDYLLKITVTNLTGTQADSTMIFEGLFEFEGEFTIESPAQTSTLDRLTIDLGSCDVTGVITSEIITLGGDASSIEHVVD